MLHIAEDTGLYNAQDMPRQKSIEHGMGTLTNSELIAILLGTGYKEKTAVEIASSILQETGNNLYEIGQLSYDRLRNIRGVGTARSLTIMAAIELGRRREQYQHEPRTKVTSSYEIANFFKAKYKDLYYEIFSVAYLNQANVVVRIETISKGGITGTVADPRIILKQALELNATNLILCHNHPSGNLQPSKADIEITKKIKEAASFHDIKVLDHIIVSFEGYFSFADDGLI